MDQNAARSAADPRGGSDAGASSPGSDRRGAGAVRLWVHCFDDAARPFVDPLTRQLAAIGLESCAFDADASHGPGLVLFSLVTDELCRFLGWASVSAAERVLAIAVSDDALDDGAAWRALGAGASDVIGGAQAPATVASEIAARFDRWSEVDRLVDSKLVRRNLVGNSPTWRTLLRQVSEAAVFTDAPMLLIGESGTGKELLARLIHSLDRRVDKRELVVLDCTTVVPELAGSEFFGHERGAYTGADHQRDGAFALADRGTLFLDEVGDLPLSLQAQLLRVVQERSFKRVGGNTWSPTSFRLVCATNRDLVSEISAGRFRADLYYRIASIVCTTPPLRDRVEDVLPLFQSFWRELRAPDSAPLALTAPIRDFLLRRAYPGNVRELRQLAARISYRHVGDGPVTLGDLPEDERPATEAGSDWPDAEFVDSVRRAMERGVGLKEIARAASETAIHVAVTAERGNLHRAAQKLGVTDRALQLRKAQHRRHNSVPRRERLADTTR